tara:strand:+ start:149 stop:469 length:321 start_codon:yes stop_codon:yes gene_type:complete
MPPVLDRVLDAFSGSRSGSYRKDANKSMPPLGKRDRSWSTSGSERPSGMNGSEVGGGRRQAAASVGTLSRADADELAKLVGESGTEAMENETKQQGGDMEEGIVFD